MEEHQKITKQIKETFLELGKHSQIANEKLRVFLKDLPQPEMIGRINHLNLSDKSLSFLCEGIALEKEDYEICMAVETIKKQRADNWLKLREDLIQNPAPAATLPQNTEPEKEIT